MRDLAGSAPATRQGGPPMTEQARTGTWESEVPGSAPEHRRLDVFIGKWINEGETVATPDVPAARIVTSDVYEWIPGRFSVLHTAYGRIGDLDVGVDRQLLLAAQPAWPGPRRSCQPSNVRATPPISSPGPACSPKPRMARMRLVPARRRPMPLRVAVEAWPHRSAREGGPCLLGLLT